MLRPLPRKLVVLQDSREKIPLLFPKVLRVYRNGGALIPVEVRVEALDIGDYTLETLKGVFSLDTKRSTNELTQNLFTKDRRRASLALDKLCSVKYPYLLLDFSLMASYKNGYRGRSCPAVDSAAVMERVFEEAAVRGLRLLWFADSTRTPAGRALVGDRVLRLMLAHLMEEPNDSNDAREYPASPQNP